MGYGRGSVERREVADELRLEPCVVDGADLVSVAESACALLLLKGNDVHAGGEVLQVSGDNLHAISGGACEVLGQVGDLVGHLQGCISEQAGKFWRINMSKLIVLEARGKGSERKRKEEKRGRDVYQLRTSERCG